MHYPSRPRRWAVSLLIGTVVFGAAVARAGTDSAPAPVAASGLSLEAIVDEGRRAQLEPLKARETRLADQERRITHMRTDLEALIAKNEAIRKDASERLARIKTANDAKMRHLIKVYEAMSPEDVAPILATMNERLVLRLLAGMKGKAVAGIMEFLPTKRAARLGEKLARPD